MFSGVTWSGRPARWLYVTAIIELVVAGIFLVVGLQNDLLRGGFLVTAAILGVLSLALLLWARRWSARYKEATRLKATGVPGQAAILGMRQTGVYVNEQPQIELNLQVQTQMHGPYQVTVKEYVPMMLLGALTSGVPLPVKVDPANPQNLVIEWESVGGMPMAGAGVMPMTGPSMGQMPTAPPPMPSSQGDDVKEQILATGTPGSAKVLQSTPTGQIDEQGRPVHSMVLLIEIEGRPPMQGPAVSGVPPERAEQLEVGDTVPVKADPANPTRIAIDWDNA